LYIVRQGHTFRNQVRLIEDLYRAKKLPGLCLLLNDVKGVSGYYGGGYYGKGYGYYGAYGYGSGYFEDDSKKRKRGSLLKGLKNFWTRLVAGRNKQ
jgi:hypothetical protein